MFILYFLIGSQFANWIVMYEECTSMPLYEFQMEEQSEIFELEKKKG